MASLADAMAGIKEPVPAPEGQYEVEVVQAEVVPTKKDQKPMLRLMMKITDEVPEVDGPTALISEYAVLPHDDDDKEMFGRRSLTIRRICEALGHNWREAAPETSEQAATMIGKSARVEVRLEHDDQYGDQNRIRWPRLSDGDSTGGSTRQRAKA